MCSLQQGTAELDLYAILGVSEVCTLSTIKKHFHRLSLALHPDRNKSAQETYKAIVLAYSILCDPVLRREYDELRATQNAPLKDHTDLKEDFSKDINQLNLRKYKKPHEEEVAMRHEHLLRAYRPRTLHEYENASVPRPYADGQKVDFKKPVRETRGSSTALITHREPEAAPPLLSKMGVMVEHQSVQANVGEMYYSGKKSLGVSHEDYLLEVSGEDIAETMNMLSAQPTRLEDRARAMKKLRSPSGIRV